MKIKRHAGGVAFLLCLALLLTVPAMAGSMGNEINAYTAQMLSGVELARGVYWTGNDYRTENFIECTPTADVYPVAVSREVLCSSGSLSAMAAQLEAEGLHVVAGINGDYFNLSSLVPVGIVVQDGILRSSCDGVPAIGFREDGSAVFGNPALDIQLHVGDQSRRVATVNKLRGEGFALFTGDFASTTQNTKKGWDVICTADADLQLKGSVQLTVEEVIESEKALALPEGKVVLSLSEDADDWLKEILELLQPGVQFEVETNCAEGWEDVQSAVGSLYKLVTAGEIESGLEKSVSPRTAVGVKADGTLVLYTVDGRQSGHSVGASLVQVAQRMIELGCVEAGVMDGGGSTNLSAVLPGDTQLSQVNSPSEGAARNVVNYIFLVTENMPTGQAQRLSLYPLDGLWILSGASAPLQVKAVDANGYAAEVPAGVRLTVPASIGAVREGVFYAGGAGTGEITASVSGLDSGKIQVNVIQTPDELTVYGERYGKVVESLTLEPGQEVDLRVVSKSNHMQLIADDLCFGWELDPEAGTVDKTGHLTAADTDGEGVLTVYAGARAVYIPITVRRPVPFDDVQEEDWFYSAVKYAYERELLSGTGNDLFSPNSDMSRAMLVTVLWRMAGSPMMDAANPFEDVKPEDWFAPAVICAAENGVVNGLTPTSFAPSEPLTREQIAVMLHRYEKVVCGKKAESGSLSEFPDGDTVSAWATESVGWAVREKIISGREGGMIQPGEKATRAEVATMIMRYLEA